MFRVKIEWLFISKLSYDGRVTRWVKFLLSFSYLMQTDNSPFFNKKQHLIEMLHLDFVLQQLIKSIKAKREKGIFKKFSYWYFKMTSNSNKNVFSIDFLGMLLHYVTPNTVYKFVSFCVTKLIMLFSCDQ